MFLKNLANIRFRITDTIDSHFVFTAEMEDPYILGLDIWMPNRCWLDLEKMEMVIRSKEIHLEVAEAPAVKILARKPVMILSSLRA